MPTSTNPFLQAVNKIREERAQGNQLASLLTHSTTQLESARKALPSLFPFKGSLKDESRVEEEKNG